MSDFECFYCCFSEPQANIWVFSDINWIPFISYRRWETFYKNFAGNCPSLVRDSTTVRARHPKKQVFVMWRLALAGSPTHHPPSTCEHPEKMRFFDFFAFFCGFYPYGESLPVSFQNHTKTWVEMDAIRLKKLETRMVENEDESWMHPTNPGCIQDESISGWMHPKNKCDITFRKYRNVLSTRNWTLSNTKLVWFVVEAVNLAWNQLTI